MKKIKPRTVHEWTLQCIADDLSLHPSKDPVVVAREWNQIEYQAKEMRRQRILGKSIKEAKAALEAFDRLMSTQDLEK